VLKNRGTDFFCRFWEQKFNTDRIYLYPLERWVFLVPKREIPNPIDNGFDTLNQKERKKENHCIEEEKQSVLL
jgi:hypothetical protein